MSNKLTIPDELNHDISNTLLEAQSLNIVDDEKNTIASDLLKRIIEFKKHIEDKLNPAINDAHLLHKKLVSQKKETTSPLEKAELILRAKISQYYQRQEQIRLEQQRKIEEAARKEEERKKKLLEEQAKKLEAKGKIELAEIKRQQIEEVNIPVPIVQDIAKKQEGISTREVWNFRIIDENLIPREYLIVDEGSIGKVVRALKRNCKIPGIEVYVENAISVKI